MRRLLSLTVSTIAALVLAAGVQAHDWTGVAKCESGGRWWLNTGNGYYGGLQFTLGTWLAMGGARYSYWPHRAAMWQQVAVAERLWRVAGTRPWPVCGRYLR